jgi:hypothetical protein
VPATQTVDVMLAGRLPSNLHPKMLRRKVFTILSPLLGPVDVAGDRGVNVFARRSVLGRRHVAQCGMAVSVAVNDLLARGVASVEPTWRYKRIRGGIVC